MTKWWLKTFDIIWKILWERINQRSTFTHIRKVDTFPKHIAGHRCFGRRDSQSLAQYSLWKCYALGSESVFSKKPLPAKFVDLEPCQRSRRSPSFSVLSLWGQLSQAFVSFSLHLESTFSNHLERIGGPFHAERIEDFGLIVHVCLAMRISGIRFQGFKFLCKSPNRVHEREAERLKMFI